LLRGGANVRRVDERWLLHASLLQSVFEPGQRLHARTVVVADPSLGELADRRCVQVVELLATAADGRDEVGCLEDVEVVAHGLPRHVELAAELTQRLPVVRVERVQQAPPARIGERFEDLVQISSHLAAYLRQPKGCLSSRRGLAPRWPDPSRSSRTT